MDKHAANREYFAADADRKLRTEQHLKAVAQLSQLEGNVLRAFELLVKFLDKKVTKTEVINQLREVSTPDVLKVVAAVEKLDGTVQQNKLDLSGVEQELKNAVEQLKQVPKTLPDAPEAIESVKVSNLPDIDLKPLLKAINALDLKVEAPIVNVDAPKVDVAPPDLKPIKAIFTDLLKAVKNIKMPDVKLEATDTSKIEKELEKQTKQLDELIKQPKGGGGGGGNGSPYTDSTGKVMNVELESNGSIPTGTILGGSDATLKDDTFYGDGVTTGIASVALRTWNGTNYDRWDGSVSTSPASSNNVFMEYDSGDSNIIYIGEAANGTATSAASWKVTKLDTTSLLAVKYADGNLNYDNVWDNRESLTYS